MGREAIVHAEVGDEAGEVRALLESTELILRGDIKRRFPKGSIDQVDVAGDLLRLTAAGEAVALQLGSRMARSWAEAIRKPPPSLRAKLGLDSDARALLVGEIDDDALAEAIGSMLVIDGDAARMIVAIIAGENDLAEARRVHARFPALPLWTVYPKGRGVSFGDGAIRAVLRAAGFRDTKSCAVSDRLTATRYNL